MACRVFTKGADFKSQVNCNHYAICVCACTDECESGSHWEQHCFVLLGRISIPCELYFYNWLDYVMRAGSSVSHGVLFLVQNVNDMYALPFM